ncbi:MAG TPA: TfoX/Sxy family protein [Lysobacter sp.]|nr:TfoX/Sxy family protein [Lysobacter sp.]
MSDAPKLLNIGGKSAAWLRQVGIRTWDDVAAIGAVEAFLRVKRAGFRPSLNLLYALEGALIGCHWQQVAIDRRTELAAQAQAGAALLPSARRMPPASAVTLTMGDAQDAPVASEETSELSF